MGETYFALVCDMNEKGNDDALTKIENHRDTGRWRLKWVNSCNSKPTSENICGIFMGSHGNSELQCK